MTDLRIAIVTATFNREELLKRLYKSLINQTNRNFSWLVIDDGSRDNTEEFIKKLNPDFDILYVKQNNGGKSRALNNAFGFTDEFDLFVVVDSDDYLLPEAVEIIQSKALEFENDQSIGAIFFRYQDEGGELLTRKNANDETEEILSRIEHDSQYVKVDGSIGYYSRTIKKYRYPEFENENYVGPTVIQLMMSEEYKIVFTQELIGVAEYQYGGLTSSGRKLRINNPLGMLVYCHYMQDEKFSIFHQIKYGILANTYKFIGNINDKTLKENKLYVPKKYRLIGKVIAKYWLRKYK